MNDEPKFTLFPKLPLELRRKIWSTAAVEAEPRIIKISCSVVIERIPFYKNEVGPCKVPPLLHTTCEARESVTKVNKIYILSPESEVQSQPIYINFAKDILYSDTWFALAVLGGYKHPREVIPSTEPGSEFKNPPQNRTIFEKEIRYLALRNWDFNDNVKLTLSRYQKLEELILLHSCDPSKVPEMWEISHPSHLQTWIPSLQDSWLEDAKERGATIEKYPEIKLMHSDAFREKFSVALYVTVLHTTPSKI
jgi:hypothetical protein